MEESNWAWLSKKLLDIILDKLVSLFEFVRFGAVCKPWQSVAMEKKFKFIQNKFSRGTLQKDVFWFLTWLAIYYARILLMNPFSSTTIELPPIMDCTELERPRQNVNDNGLLYETKSTPTEVEFEVTKAILSADPALSPNDYIVAATYGGCNNLAFIWASNEAWTYIDKKRFKPIFDVIYYKGRIFVVVIGRVLMIDVNRRAGESKAPQVEGFKVFKLLFEQFEQGSHMLVEVKNLVGDTLFLGDSHSICVSASKWPGCQPNSINYTDDFIDFHFHPSGRCDMGIFNIENGRFGPHYILDPSHNHMPPSIWIVPTVLGNSV
ncbi:probable F-box protein At1g44080 [Cornus florida]|uniref:probable F-box protein At1g44080 n=1 Tax=Cornus florida TaxID=4283 RepID=UPI00289A7FD2|nr:probable F-box protein At1g44080 [Cornus florida]XP_059627453.1 probable F-box protein At1g44080 [Cornus florida]